MPPNKRVYENQTTHVYSGDETDAPGGRGWRLPDLNIPLPSPDEAWLAAQLAERGVGCDYPDCTAQAVGLVLVRRHVPFVCAYHKMICTTGKKSLMRQAQTELAQAALQAILDTTYGTTTRITTVVEQLLQPLPGPAALSPRTKKTAPKPRPRKASITSLPVLKPRFGQL